MERTKRPIPGADLAQRLAQGPSAWVTRNGRVGQHLVALSSSRAQAPMGAFRIPEWLSNHRYLPTTQAPHVERIATLLAYYFLRYYSRRTRKKGWPRKPRRSVFVERTTHHCSF
jgi:hypothetical protein